MPEVSNDLKVLSQKYFGFLVEEHNFRYDKQLNAFDNGYVRFRIEQWDSLSPSIEVWLKSEPKFTRIDLSWLLEDPIHHKAMDKLLFEDRLAYYAQLMRRRADLLFHNIEGLLIEGLKDRFVSEIEPQVATKNLDLASKLPPGLEKYFHYLKQKDPKWDPSKSLPRSIR